MALLGSLFQVRLSSLIINPPSTLPIASVPRLLSGDDGPSRIHSALLVPSQSKPSLVPLSPVFLTSQDAQVTNHPNARSVYITSPARGGLLSLQTLSPDALIASLIAALPSVLSIPDPDNHHAILLAHPDQAPTHLFVIPLSPHASTSPPSTLSVPLSPILSHVQSLSNPSSYFSISNPTRFIPTSADQIQLGIPDFGGARFSLSPVYDLVKPDGDARLSLLSKHSRITNPTGHSLLTPPPSPPLDPTETETQPSRSLEDSHELTDQLPAVHVHHVDDQTSEPIEPALTSGQSTPDPGVQEQLGSGQTSPKPRPAINGPSDRPPSAAQPVKVGTIRKLIRFVLRILAFYTRILSRVILTIFARLFPFHVPKREPVATPKVGTLELDDDQAEVKPTSVSSAVHVPTFLTPRTGTPKPQRGGASTPLFHEDTVNRLDQNLPGVVETLEAATTKIVPEFTAKVGEEKPQENLGGSYVQELGPDPEVRNEKSGHNEKWEVVHRPGIVFELTALPYPPATTEGKASPKIKPIRLTLDGAESVVKGIKYHLDDTELTNVKVERLTGTEQEGLWTVEVPRMSRDLTTLRIF